MNFLYLQLLSLLCSCAWSCRTYIYLTHGFVVLQLNCNNNNIDFNFTEGKVYVNVILVLKRFHCVLFYPDCISYNSYVLGVPYNTGYLE